MQSSLRTMRAPASLACLNMLSAAGALWVCSSYELPTQKLTVDRLQLSVQGMKGAAVPAALGALQVCVCVCVLSLLGHRSRLDLLSTISSCYTQTHCDICTAAIALGHPDNFLLCSLML